MVKLRLAAIRETSILYRRLGFFFPYVHAFAHHNNNTIYNACDFIIDAVGGKDFYK